MSTEDRRSTSAKRRVIPQSEDELSRAAASQERARQGIKKRKKSSLWDKYSYHIVIGGFLFVILITVLTTAFGKTKKLHLTPVIETDEIESHNQYHTDFKLGPNTFFQDQTLADAKKILNNYFSFKQSLSRCLSDENTILETRYDFREKYPQCVIPVMNQKNCSSSYAIASANVISERICQETGAHVQLSSQEYLSCQEGAEGKECEGGAIASFLDFARRKGLVDEKCIPYVGENDAVCNTAAQDRCEKHQITEYCVAGPTEGIKRDILKHGPSIAYIPIYRDFLVYKSGIYRVQEGVSKFQGGHALEIVGWGQSDDGQGYWIVKNSWGEDWGMKGYAHIAFGQEELMIDEYAFSPKPKNDKDDDFATDTTRRDEGDAMNI